MGLPGGADESDGLIVGVLADVSAVDHQHLIALVQSRHAHIRRTARRHSRHDYRVVLVSSTLQSLTTHFEQINKTTWLWKDGTERKSFILKMSSLNN